MIDRLHFLVVYVGSAAMAAFLAVCVSTPRVATYTCDGDPANGTQHCELLDTLAIVAPASGDTSASIDVSDTPGAIPVVLAEAR